MTETTTPTKTIHRTCVSPSSKDKICLLYANVVENTYYRRKLITGGERKSKACSNLELILGKEFAVPELPSYILCRNCADKNETLVNKISDVRSRFESSVRTIGEKLGKTETSVKRLYRSESSDVDGEPQNHASKRALFAKNDCTSTPRASEDSSSVVNQSVDPIDLEGEQNSSTQVSRFVIIASSFNVIDYY